MVLFGGKERCAVRRREFAGLAMAGGFAAAFDGRAFAAEAAGGGKTVVLGGGVFALGYALAHPESTLVLERGIHLGMDYAGTTGPAAAGEATTEAGRELLGAMEEAGILKDGVMELPPLADFLAAYFCGHGGKAFMCAELTGLEKRGKGYRVRIMGGGSEGELEFDAGGFADTTAAGWRNFGADAVTGKRFGGIAPDLTYFNVELPAGATWHEARLALYDAWKRAGRDSRELLAETNAIKHFYGGRRVERVNGELGYKWTPSGQFKDFITAYEEGRKWSVA